MGIVGFDLGKHKSQICVVRGDGSRLERRLATTPEALTEFFAGLERSKVLLEAYTSSEWIARLLEGLGHEVIVADPNFGPMYAQADKRIKTDKRDARALCEALRVGAYRATHRRSDENRALRAELSVRESLVGARGDMVRQCRSVLEGVGIIVKSCSVESFVDAVTDGCGSLRATVFQRKPEKIQD